MVLSNYSIKDRVVVAVIDLPLILSFGQEHAIKYKGISNYPASTRDISMVVPKDILAGEIESVFRDKGGAYLESFRLFDIYEGAQIMQGFKSMAYSLVFRAKDKNLADEDVNAAMDRILKALDAKGIKLRA